MRSVQHHVEDTIASQQAHPTPIKLLLTMDEAARALGLGVTSFYDLVMKKQIASIKIGRSRRVPIAALEEFVARQLEETHAPPLDRVQH